jgi:hypothetical protein
MDADLERQCRSEGQRHPMHRNNGLLESPVKRRIMVREIP